jgi:hypothetical protein
MGFFDDLIPAARDEATGAPRITVTPNEPDLSLPRGIRNNNPLNIEAGAFTSGQPGFSGSDGRFARFAEPQQGVDAASKLLDTYQSKHGLNTVNGIIARWAPSNENNTRSYAATVARQMGVHPDQPLTPEQRPALIAAMGQVENGRPISTEFSSQARRPAAATGFFDDLVPQGQAASSPDALPSASSGGQPAPRVAREGMSEPAPPPTSTTEAGARSAAIGVTANFYDELRGLMEAGGLNPKDPASLGALLSGAYKYWTGDEKAAEKYDMTVARERGLTQKAEADQPVASITGNIVGGAILPLGAAARGASLAERATQGARVGAAVGGLSGVGAGEDTAGRVVGGAVGAGAGAALGAAVPAVVEGAVRTGRAASVPIANAVRGIRDPEGEAARRVALGLQRDIQADPQAAQRLTPAEFGASVQSGGPATIMDLGGETTRALARSAANTSPEGRGVLNRAINDRFEGQTGRVTTWLNDTFNFPNATAQQEALEQTARAVNRGAYARAYNDRGAQSLWDGTFEQISQAPVVQDAIRGATRTGGNQAAAQGFTPIRNPFRFDEQSQRMVLADPNVRPNLQFWDHVKRNLDDTVTKLQRTGENSAARDAIQLRTALLGHIDNQVPAFAQARAGAAHFFGAENALEAGQNFVMQNFAAPATRRALANMTPTERQLFQDGFVSRYIETLNRVGDRRSILNQIGANPAAREKLTIALGPQRATELEAGLRAEGIMDFARGAVQGNSTTARQLTELGLAGGTYGIGTGFDIMNPNPSALMSAALVYGAARGRTRINENLARHVAELLVSNDPRHVIRGVQMVSRNQNMLNSLRSFDQGLSRVSSQQAPGVPALQAAGVSRAEDQQDVPRPPGQ